MNNLYHQKSKSRCSRGTARRAPAGKRALNRIGIICLIFIALFLAACRPTTPTPTLPPATDTPAPPTVTPSPDPPVTLAVPTQVPYPTPSPTPLPDVSGVQRILDAGVLRVGIKLNEPPFGTLDREGNIAGYDADIARSLADSWGVELELIQVTNQTAVDYLLGGEVDLLIAAMAHRREHEAYMDFSQSYFPDGPAVMVPAGSDIGEVGQLAGRRVAVVAGSTAEEALAVRGLEVELTAYDILDDAIAALMAGEADAVVETLVHLRAAEKGLTPGAATILDEMLGTAPLAVGLPRHDTNLRNALNRTLQALERGGRMKEIHNAWFPGHTYPGMVTWEDDDTRSFADYPRDIVYVASVVARLRGGETLRVAGLSLDPPDESAQRAEAFYRGLVEAMAAHWDVSVVFLPGSHENPAAWVAEGRADLAVGVEPRWDGVDAVEYGQALLLHGNRLMVLKDSRIETFSGLLGKRVGVFGPNAAEDEEMAKALARSVNVNLPNVSHYDDAEAAVAALKRNREDVIFGDSLALGPLLEANPDTLRFTERFYSRHGVAFAVPQGDADFRALVNFTLQELVTDGTYDRLYDETLGFAEPLPVEVWPGDASWLWPAE